MTTFLRLLEAGVDDKPAELLRTVTALREAGSEAPLAFERDPAAFATVPGSPFAYWVSKRILDTFQEVPAFNAGSRVATVGLQSSDDFRFLRLWFEPHTRASFRPFAKGGSFSPFYADLYVSIIWDRNGFEVKAFAETTPGSKHWSRNIRSAEHYLRPGLTWPRRTNGLSFRAMPAGCIFADKGPAAFVEGDSPDRLLALPAILNSVVFGYLVSVQLARTELAQSYEVGLIQQTPIPNLSDADTVTLARLARRAWSLKRSLDTTNETSHAFLLPPDVNERFTGLDRAAVNRELEEIQRQIDDEAFRLYAITEEDRTTIEGRGDRPVAPTTMPASDAAVEEDDEAERDDEGVEADGEAFGDEDFNVYNTLDSANEYVNSWLVGVAFGRFDPRLAAGERAIPPEPEPFDPLPSRSPGMVPEGEEPATLPDILVGDIGHPDDIATRVLMAGGKLGVSVGEGLPAWLAKDFFSFHIKMYSKSRRKAPIYWQLATPSASYSVWLYIHAFSKDTLFRVQNDYAAPKLAHEERSLEAMVGAGLKPAPTTTAQERKAIAAQESLVEELRVFLEEVRRVAPLWNPDLDDGVIINFAPLWRLVPQQKPWQKELKATWDALSAGKYDWAHLAMHLWPERVVPKCASDRSLAIAHGLEEVFWAEGDKGKWAARKAPTRSVDELVAERTSAAVKAALGSLQEAPAATGTAKKTRKRKANA